MVPFSINGIGKEKNMKKTVLLLLSGAIFAAAAAVQAQGMAPANRDYECGYYYQDGLRVTDCDDDPAGTPVQGEAVGAYEGYTEDTAERIENPSSMLDMTDDYSGLEKFGDPNGIHFIKSIEYSYSIGNYQAEMQIPEIRGMADPDQQASLNDFIRSIVYSAMDEFEREGRAVLDEYAVEDAPHYYLSYDFDIVTSNESVVTLALSYFSAGGSSYRSNLYFNFNRQTRELILMDDYFIPGSAAASILRDEILRQMRAEMDRDPETIYWIDENAGENGEMELNWDDLLANVGNNYGYYINEFGELVVAFNKYEVAPGVMGTPEFTIPMGVLTEMDKTIFNQ